MNLFVNGELFSLDFFLNRHCEVCRSGDPRDKRTRASCWIRSEDFNLVIDSGVDFRQQALREGLERLKAVLLTHHHADHIFGLDDVRPINYLQQADVWVYAENTTLYHLKRIYQYVFNPPAYHADIPMIRTVEISEKPFKVGPLEVLPLPVKHGPLDIFGFRIGKFAYITDVSHIPESTMEKLHGLEVLILGALRDRYHPNHFTIADAVKAARKIGARQTYLTHLSHEVGHRELLDRLPEGIEPAYDGLKLTIIG
ncbi:MAG: MBL fold metallo-hydrolase [Calditrichia bacterium]